MEQSTQRGQNANSFQQHMKKIWGYITLGHKTNLNKFKRIEIISSDFYDNNIIKLEINTWKKLKNSKIKGN